MILTSGPDDVCFGSWFVLTDDSVWRFSTLTRAIERIRDTQRKFRLNPLPPKHYFVHWSFLTDEERNRIFSAI